MRCPLNLIKRIIVSRLLSFMTSFKFYSIKEIRIGLLTIVKISKKCSIRKYEWRFRPSVALRRRENSSPFYFKSDYFKQYLWALRKHFNHYIKTPIKRYSWIIYGKVTDQLYTVVFFASKRPTHLFMEDTRLFTAWFILQIVTAGNGIWLIYEAEALLEIITGVADHF